jgi:RimJ/RimL family protein N-acetyltransferase
VSLRLSRAAGSPGDSSSAGLTLRSVNSLDADERTAVANWLQAVSRDEIVVNETYLPPSLSPEESLVWLASRPDFSWLIVVDGFLAGYYECAPVHDTPPCSLPPNVLECEYWLVPEFRGRGWMTDATRKVAGLLSSAGVAHVLGVAWETNTASVEVMRRCGFRRLGRHWWSSPGHASNWCEYWLLSTITG